MVLRDELIKFIENSAIGQEALDQARAMDELANGIQFLGGDKVNKLTLGVSLNEDFLKEAVESDSNFCVFHHGFDVRTHNSLYSLSSQKRLRLIIENNLTIAGYHAALDIHPEIGNNASIIKALGANIGDPLFEGFGYTATFKEPQDVHELAKKCASLFEHDILAIYDGPDKIKTIGVVSGAAKPYAKHILEMKQKGVELFISGETSESRPNMLKEEGINYFVCGHYATEVFGVQELGKKVKSHFKDKLDVEFIDIHNPV